jgi:LPS O-antigen subunit length determinant protein (WzzB/FepE family)
MNDAIKLFHDDLLSVDEDQLSGVIHVTLVWYDRVLAAQWCNGLIELTNRTMQAKARELAAKRIGFLEKEYQGAATVNLQASISTLLQTDLSRAADASTRPEYALRVIDPASVPDDRHPVRPRKAVIGAISGVLGALLALAVVGVRKRRTG